MHFRLSGIPENQLDKNDTFALTDFVRLVSNAESRDILGSNFVASLSALLTVADTQKSIRSETTNTSIAATDEILRMDCSGGNRAVLLPDAADVFTILTGNTGIGQVFVVKRSDKTVGNDCQLNTTNSQLIDGDANWILSGSASEQVWVSIVSNGTGWDVIG